jgi:hypothetical protein
MAGLRKLACTLRIAGGKNDRVELPAAGADVCHLWSTTFKSEELT